MQKRFIVGSVAVSVVVAASGFFVGRHTVVQTNPAMQNTESGIVGSTTITPPTIEGQPSKIAVVNQDQGTTLSSSENVNYANQVIKTLNDNYVVTSREAAKKGIADGTYAAMIVLPGNFSNNAESINTNPKSPTKIEVYYEMNKNLNPTNNAIIKGEIQNFQSNLNNKFSVMYIQGIVGQVHQGQEYIEKIFSNDTKDLEAINSIHNIEFLKGINLTDLEYQNINIDNIDFSKNFEENKDIMNQLDSIYKGKIATNEAEVASIKNDLSNLVNDESTGLKAIQNKISKLTTQELIDALAKSHNYEYEELKELYDLSVEDVNKYVKYALTGSTDCVGEKANKAISEINSLLDENEKSANAIKEYIKSNGNTNTSDSTTTESVPTLSNSSLSQEYLLYGKIANELIKDDPKLFEELYKKVAESKTVSYNKILKNIQGSNTADNVFADSEALKSYLLEKSAGTTDFVSERNTAYSSMQQSANKDKTDTNTNTGEGLDKIKAEAEKIKTATAKVKNSENYKYLKDLFDEESENSLENVVESSIKGNKKDELLNKIKENNKSIIEKTKTMVENQIEKDGVVNITALMGMLDKDYIDKFEAIIGRPGSAGNTSDLTAGQDPNIVGLWMQYDISNKNLANAVTTQISQYTETMQNSQKDANERVQAMRENLDKGIQETQNNINSTIGEIQENKQETTDSNRKNLSSFANILKDTKIGSSEDTSLYSFIASPVSVQENKTLTSSIKSTMSNNNDTFRFITLGSVAAAILYLTLKMRKKLNK